MPKQYDDTNRGVLFKEQDKQSDKHPDYTGGINVNGTEYRLAGWIKEGKKGKFLSLAVSSPNGKKKDEGDVPF